MMSDYVCWWWSPIMSAIVRVRKRPVLISPSSVWEPWPKESIFIICGHKRKKDVTRDWFCHHGAHNKRLISYCASFCVPRIYVPRVIFFHLPSREKGKGCIRRVFSLNRLVLCSLTFGGGEITPMTTPSVLVFITSLFFHACHGGRKERKKRWRKGMRDKECFIAARPTVTDSGKKKKSFICLRRQRTTFVFHSLLSFLGSERNSNSSWPGFFLRGRATGIMTRELWVCA